ncbi:MAG: RNA polymerase sigma factor [Pseudomonadales bacterium]|nr:RNA polymerase sigma factor [Pseudomonadales bacterium]
MANWQAISAEIPALRRYARSLLQDSDLADDLVQTSLVKAANKWSCFTSAKALRPWLFKIMHNQFVDDYRKHKKLQQYQSRQSATLLSIAGQDSAKDQQYIATLDIDRALDTLSIESRELFLMASLEGFSYAQISKILNIPQGTVMSRLSRIRIQLREKLKPYQEMINTDKAASKKNSPSTKDGIGGNRA